MNPALLLSLTIEPVLTWLATMGVKSDDRARIMLLTIAGQESGLRDRRQMGNGPARGLWQFEPIAALDVLTRHSTRTHALTVCRQLLVPSTKADVHSAIEQNDLLACAFARLLLFTDPGALPTDSEDGWTYYKRTWRPGKPKPETWGGHWKTAVDSIKP